jgi:hypothetical protein
MGFLRVVERVSSGPILRGAVREKGKVGRTIL